MNRFDWLLIPVGVLCMIGVLVVTGADIQENYSRDVTNLDGALYAVYDTMLTTSAASVDTIYFGGMAVQQWGEISAATCSLAWHQDYKAIPVYGTLSALTIESGRRKGLLLVQNTKKWAVAAGLSYGYTVPVSAMVVKGTGNGKAHVCALVRVK